MYNVLKMPYNWFGCDNKNNYMTVNLDLISNVLRVSITSFLYIWLSKDREISYITHIKWRENQTKIIIYYNCILITELSNIL